MKRPESHEYDPYCQHYIDLVPQGEFWTLWEQNTFQMRHLFGNLPQEKHDLSYAEGKWTPKQMLQHIIDTERIFSYRALVISRGDTTTHLPSFDENSFAQHANVSDRTMTSLLDEFLSVRYAAKMLFQNMSETDSRSLGKGPSYPVSPRALAYMLIGHGIHHINVVNERYL
jgi:uncharacterized damage-inducible protein DinB